MQKYFDFLYIFSGYLKKLFILCLILIKVYIDGAPHPVMEKCSGPGAAGPEKSSSSWRGFALVLHLVPSRKLQNISDLRETRRLSKYFSA